MRRFLLVTFALFASLALAVPAVCSAQNSTEIRGKVVDASGATIPNASISLRDLTTNKVIHAKSGTDGAFEFMDVAPEAQLLTIEKSGFESFTKRIVPSSVHSTTIEVRLNVATLSESVVVRGTVDPEAKPVPSREDVLLTPDTLRVLDRKQLDAGGPVAGGAQMIQSTPGANVIGYGETGATKYTVLLNGIQQGWAGENQGFTAPGSLGVTFDGVPVGDPATGLWQSATMPQNLVMQDLAVTYGPGQPMNRWYNGVGGSIEFTPVQPTVDRHLSVELTQGPYGQQNFAFVGNTGNVKGWETVLGGGLGRGDDFRPGPDGFGNPAKDGSVLGKTIKNFSAGSIVLGVFYAKSGGYRAQVIPTTDIGLVEPAPYNNLNYSQATSGYYSSLAFDAYHKYDTNEMFLAYARENLFLSPTMSLQNTTFFNHIRRFHHRTADALNQGSQVDEWNNPHSNIFGDQAGMSVVLPLNTVNFGGFLVHELYNSHNLFFNPADGGDGAHQIVGVGSKFRSGYFQYDNVAFFAQDDFHPIPRIHIIPGLRVVGFGTDYSNQAYRDFTLASGVIPSTHCAEFSDAGGAATDPFFDIFSPDRFNADGSANLSPTTNAKDQGSICGEHASKGAVEPSIDASWTPVDWLTIYGGYDATYRAPALGGGGGMFQQVDPAYYILAEGKYAQFGGKVHFTHAPGLGNFIAGINYYHLDYNNIELDYETALGVTGTSGGNSAYHGVDLFFDADPASNMHFFLNFAGEAANYTTYALGNTLAACNADPSSCQFYNNLPVSYVPNYTLNTGLYYGIRRNGREFLEPRFWIESTGSQNIWNNNTGAPDKSTEQAYTTANMSFTAPISFEKQSFNLKVDLLNLANTQYNQNEYISSGGYFAALFPDQNNVPSGYINAYPGAPRAIYGTLTYQF